MSWSWAEETRRDVLENNLGKEGLDLFVLARDGTVLVGEDAEGTSLSRETAAYDPGNPDMVVAEVETSGLGDYPGLGWKVAVQQPVSVVSARVAALVRNIFLIGFAVAVFPRCWHGLRLAPSRSRFSAWSQHWTGSGVTKRKRQFRACTGSGSFRRCLLPSDRCCAGSVPWKKAQEQPGTCWRF